MESQGNDNDDGWETVDVKKKENRRSGRDALQAPKQPPSWFLELTPIPSPCDGLADAPPFEPFMLLLMGFPGAGKSTIAKKLEEILPWKYERINQDELGSRQACLRRAEEVLVYDKKCPIIDRCNAGAQHRKPFLQLAKEVGCPVDCIILEVPKQVCIQRCKAREDHPTVAPQDAEKIVGFMKRDWKLPKPHEEIRSIWRISDEEDLRELLLRDKDLAELLLRIE